MVLVPQEKERRDRAEYYKTTTTDQNGNYTLKGLVPGEYKAYAWEDVEPGAYLDSDFLKPIEEQSGIGYRPRERSENRGAYDYPCRHAFAERDGADGAEELIVRSEGKRQSGVTKLGASYGGSLLLGWTPSSHP